MVVAETPLSMSDIWTREMRLAPPPVIGDFGLTLRAFGLWQFCSWFSIMPSVLT